MNMYFATVRLKGISVKTAVYADSTLHARLILEFHFGIGSVIIAPALTKQTNEHYQSLDEVVATIKPIKPLTPQQSRIDSLKKVAHREVEWVDFDGKVVNVRVKADVFRLFQN